MSTINFPDTTNQPTDGTFTYEFEGIIYIWDGEKWFSQGHGSTSSTVGDGHLIIKDSDGNELGTFTANQPTGSNTEVTLPPGGGSVEQTTATLPLANPTRFIRADPSGLTHQSDFNQYIHDYVEEVEDSVPANTSDLNNDSGFITDAGVTKIVAGTNVTIDPADGTGEVTINSSGGGGGGFSGDYNDLTNKPDIPDATSDLTNDSGFITDAGVTKIVAGTNVTISPTDGTGEVTINAAGGGGSTVTKTSDLTNDGEDGINPFIATKDLPFIAENTSELINDAGFITDSDVGNGMITIKQGGAEKGVFFVNQSSDQEIDLDAGGGGGFSGDYNDLTNKPTIPTDNNQLNNGAGYITAAQVPSPGLQANGVTAPLEIDGGQNLKLNYNRGLMNNLDQLEVRLGARMNFDGSGAITTDAPPDAVDAFAPITIINSGSVLEIPCQRNYQEIASAFTGSFTLPDGVNKVSIISRVRVALEATGDGEISGTTVPTLWCEGIGFEVAYSGGLTDPQNGFNYSNSDLRGLAMPWKASRILSAFCIRMNTFEVPGSGNRTITYTGKVKVADAHGGSPPGGKMTFNGLNLQIYPIAT